MHISKYITKKASSLSLSLSNKLKHHNNHLSSTKITHGFTIVELLVVIVVIGILAAITIVSYTGITQRATAASLQSDLSNASQQLKMYYADNSAYPTVNQCPTPSAGNICLKPSSGNTFTYSSNGTTFALTNTNTNGTAYGINDTSSPVALAQPTDCPTGFIPVPGSSTYATAGFCVMKYAASQVGATTTPQSVPSVLPWVSISQTTAIANSPNVAGCTGCHLITEAEWMAIAQNVLSVPSNWFGGVVGTNYIYSGHNDSAPANTLVPDPSDANGYAGETNTGGNQRRTLTLTNGQVIWDLAGNVWQWTAGTSTTGQPGIAGNAYASWIQWPNVTTHGTLFQDPFPGTTGISGSSAWTSTQGIGQLLSNPAETGLHGFIRGGLWSTGGSVGVLTLILNYGPGYANGSVGFRVSR